MNDIYKIHISFDRYVSDETVQIYHTISECDKIDEHLLNSILSYRNNKLRVQHNKNLGPMRASGKYKEEYLQVLDVPDDFKYKVDKEYDELYDVVSNAHLVFDILKGKGRNVCIEIAQGWWGCDCCEECGSYQWETIKTIKE